MVYDPLPPIEGAIGMAGGTHSPEAFILHKPIRYNCSLVVLYLWFVYLSLGGDHEPRHFSGKYTKEV